MTTDGPGQEITRHEANNVLDPQALLRAAVEHGAGIETLERLTALAREVRAMRAREAWYEAMAKFQATCPPIYKTASAKIQTRGGSSYGYKYAPLDEIVSTIAPVLAAEGLSFRWFNTIEPQRVTASCRVSHVLGHSEESGVLSMPIMGAQDGSGANAAQQVGIALTYAKRYSLLSILGLAPETDTDAHPATTTQPPDTSGAEPTTTTTTAATPTTTTAASPPPSSSSNSDRAIDERVITEQMRKRFHAIANGRQWTTEQIGDLLIAYGYAATAEIRAKHYDAMIDVVKGTYEQWRAKNPSAAA
jgi:hypothetical protein